MSARQLNLLPLVIMLCLLSGNVSWLIEMIGINFLLGVELAKSHYQDECKQPE